MNDEAERAQRRELVRRAGADLAAGGGKDPRGCWLPDAEAQAARDMVESAGLAYLAAPYIADEVRRLGTGPAGAR